MPSSQVELWSPIYLGSGGMSLYVEHCDLYQCPPNTDTSFNAAPTWTTKGRRRDCEFRVSGPTIVLAFPPDFYRPAAQVCLPARSHPRRDGRLSLTSLKPSGLVATDHTQMERNHVQLYHHPAPLPTFRLA